MIQEKSVFQSQRFYFFLETLCVFILAGLVRLTSLGVFRAIDEEDRWAWAINFYRALLAGDMVGTLVGDGYPGIFPVWLETVWLFMASVYRSILQGEWIGEPGIYALIHEWQRWSNLAMQRFPVAFVNTILVVLTFLYVRRLFGRWTGLLAAIFMALDPFYLSDSRVNRAEALLTGLMTVSFLALVTALRQSDRRYLVASGIFGGLAWLTKSQSIVLIPMLSAVSFIWLWHEKLRWQTILQRWLVTMVSWGFVAAITFIILWPAAWTVPKATFDLMYGYATRKVGAEGSNLFFMGQTLVDEDPGFLFYPIVFFLRVSPLVLTGLILGAWLLFHQRCFHRENRGRDWLDHAGVWALIAYCVLYMGGMSVGGHKQDRFLMAIFPMLDILAAIAFVRFVELYHWPVRRIVAAGGGLLMLQLIIVLPYHPYYYTYFNPLVGGGRVASRVLRIGWGEGMDQVGAYLNSLEESESLIVSSRFSQYLLGFDGETLQLDADGKWLQADKIIFYIQQVQRMQDPSPGTIRYFQQHITPEKIINIDGIDYAWIYPNPITYPASPQVDRVEGKMALLGYRWVNNPEGAKIHLVWENLGQVDGHMAVRLWASDKSYTEWTPCTTAVEFEQAAQTPGEIVESECLLTSGGLKPGLYNLQLGVGQNDGNWQPLSFVAGQSAVELDQHGELRRVDPEAAFAKIADQSIPASAIRLERGYNYQVRLLAYQVSPTTLGPGNSLTLTTYWQAPALLTDDAHVTAQAFIGDERIDMVNGPPAGGTRHTKSWLPGEVIKDERTITLPGDLTTPALLRLDVGLFNPETLVPWQAHDLTGQDVPGEITRLRIEPDNWPVYQGEHPLNFVFGNAIRLLGYEATASPGETLNLTLYWECLAPLDIDHTAFVHLLGPDGALLAQSDVLPGGDQYPVSAWQPENVILSHHQLALPAGPTPNKYHLLIGLYRPDDWTRLPVVDQTGAALPNNAALLEEIHLQE